MEDEENLHEALKLNLEMEGYEAVSAYTGKEALQKINNEYFDLIIMDIMLPEIDGISITETIRVSNNDVPILMLSARNSSADKVLGLKKGADDYLTKPFNLEELLLRVDKLIDKSKKMQVKESIGVINLKRYLAEFLGTLRDAGWSESDIRQVESSVRKVLAGVMSNDQGPQSL